VVSALENAAGFVLCAWPGALQLRLKQQRKEETQAKPGQPRYEPMSRNWKKRAGAHAEALQVAKQLGSKPCGHDMPVDRPEPNRSALDTQYEPGAAPLAAAYLFSPAGCVMPD